MPEFSLHTRYACLSEAIMLLESNVPDICEQDIIQLLDVALNRNYTVHDTINLNTSKACIAISREIDYAQMEKNYSPVERFNTLHRLAL